MPWAFQSPFPITFPECRSTRARTAPNPRIPQNSLAFISPLLCGVLCCSPRRTRCCCTFQALGTRVCGRSSSSATPASAPPRTCGLKSADGLAREPDPILSFPFHWSAPTGTERTNVGKPRSSGPFRSRGCHVILETAHRGRMNCDRIHRPFARDDAMECVRRCAFVLHVDADARTSMERCASRPGTRPRLETTRGKVGDAGGRGRIVPSRSAPWLRGGKRCGPRGKEEELRIVKSSAQRRHNARHSDVGYVRLVDQSTSSTCCNDRTSSRRRSASSSWHFVVSPPSFAATHVDRKLVLGPGIVAMRRPHFVRVAFRFDSFRFAPSTLLGEETPWVCTGPPLGFVSGSNPALSWFEPGWRSDWKGEGASMELDGEGSVGGGQVSAVAARWRVETDSNAWRLGSRR